MSKRASVAGLIVSVALLGLTVALVAGASIPGPPVREWLDIDEPPLPEVCTLDPAQVVDPGGTPAPGAWVSLADSPTPSPEEGAVAIGKYVYLVGGQLREGTEAIFLRYDSRDDSYRREPDAPIAVDHPVVAAHNGEVILASGYEDGATSTNRAWAYSPATREWRELAPMSQPRGAAAGAVVGNELYVAGGLREFGNQYEPTDSLEIYDFETDQWRAGPPMPTPRHHLGAAVLDGKIYFAGGRRPEDQSQAAFEVFDPAAMEWTVLPEIPIGTGAPGVAAVDGRIVVSGGGNEADPGTDLADGTILKASFSYDPASATWERLPDLGRARHGHASAAVGNRVFVFRGVPCPGYGQMASVEALEVN